MILLKPGWSLMTMLQPTQPMTDLAFLQLQEYPHDAWPYAIGISPGISAISPGIGPTHIYHCLAYPQIFHKNCCQLIDHTSGHHREMFMKLPGKIHHVFDFGVFLKLERTVRTMDFRKIGSHMFHIVLLLVKHTCIFQGPSLFFLCKRSFFSAIEWNIAIFY